MALNLLELTLPSPASNLALDEALLDRCENSRPPGFLRFWEPPDYFVVLGYGKKLQSETFAAACRALRVPILRRCSGGGTVLQGPGCVNYALALPIDAFAELETITSANRFIMQRHRAACSELLGQDVEIQGHTDLVLGGRKFSGNAQRRKRRALLFHGSFLLRLDLGLMTKLLPVPEQQPAYRRARPHLEFLANAPIEAGLLKAALARAWNASGIVSAGLRDELLEMAERLRQSQYSTSEWNERF